MPITRSQANQLRHLVGRVNSAVQQYHTRPEGEEAENAADRELTNASKELSTFIDNLEEVK